MERLKAIQIGCGHDHAFASIRCLKSLNEIFDLVGYVKFDSEEEVFNANRSSYDGVECMTLEQAFAIPDLKVAIIETDDLYLTKYAKIALERGLAVQMDKPGGQNADEFNEMMDYAKANGLVLHLGYMYRYNPALIKALEIVKSGELGEVYSVESQMSCYLSEKKRAWLKNFRGGMTNFLGCHLIDFILRLQGVPQEIIPLNTVSREDLGGEDVGFVVFKYPHAISFAKCNCMETGGPMRRKIVITGEKGSIEINPTEYPKAGFGDNIFTDIRIAYSKNDFWNCRPQAITFGPYDRYQTMFTEFANIVRGEIENPYSYEYEKTLHDLLIKACGIK